MYCHAASPRRGSRRRCPFPLESTAVAITYHDQFVTQLSPIRRSSMVATDRTCCRSETHQMVRALEGRSARVQRGRPTRVTRSARPPTASPSISTSGWRPAKRSPTRPPEVFDDVSAPRAVGGSVARAGDRIHLLRTDIRHRAGDRSSTKSRRAATTWRRPETGVSLGADAVAWQPHAIQELSTASEKTAMQQTAANSNGNWPIFVPPVDDVRGNHATSPAHRTLSISKTVTELCELSVNWLAT